MLLELFVKDATGAGADTVLQVVRERTGEVQHCYEQALKRDPDLHGRVEMQWTIQRSGRVVGVGVHHDTTGDEELTACITASIEGWLFPVDKANGDVVFPFVLTQMPASFQSSTP